MRAATLPYARSPLGQGFSLNTESRFGLFDLFMLFLITGPLLGTFFPLEGYFGTRMPNGELYLYPFPFAALTQLVMTGTLIALVFKVRKPKVPLAPFLYMGCVLFSVIYFSLTGSVAMRALRLIPDIGLAIMLPQLYSREKLVRMLCVAFAVSAICSIAACLLLPTYAIGGLGGAYTDSWKGALPHKNACGFVYGMGIAIILAAAMSGTIKKLWAGIFILPCLFMLVMSQSFSPVASSAVAMAATVIAVGLRRTPSHLSLLIFCVTLFIAIDLVFFVVVQSETVADLIGRDLTFTGRTDIWAAVTPIAIENPLVGHGYNFWANDTAERFRVWSEVQDKVAHSHNSWLDLLLQMGIAPILILLYMLGKGIFKNFALYREGEGAALPFFTIAFFFAIYSLTEVAFSPPSTVGIFWLTLAMMTRGKPATTG